MTPIKTWTHSTWINNFSALRRIRTRPRRNAAAHGKHGLSALRVSFIHSQSLLSTFSLSAARNAPQVWRCHSTRCWTSTTSSRSSASPSPCCPCPAMAATTVEEQVAGATTVAATAAAAALCGVTPPTTIPCSRTSRSQRQPTICW